MTKVSKLHHIDLEDGKFAQTTAADLAQIFAEIRKEQAQKIVLHFHGGLVSRDSGHASALKLLPDYEAAGAYPIFTIWNTRETAITKNLDEIAQEPVFKQLVRRIGQFVIGKMVETVTAGVGAKGIDELSLEPLPTVPVNLEDLEGYLSQKEAEIGAIGSEMETLSDIQDLQVQRELEKDGRIQRETQKIANHIKEEKGLAPPGGTKSVATTETTETLMSQVILTDIEDEMTDPSTKGLAVWLTIARFGWKITRQVIKRFNNATDHTLYTTIVEEVLRTLYVDSLGTLAWNLIKNDTADAFDPNEPQAGSRKLLEHLAAYWQENPNLEVFLVGHSAGSIYVGQCIDAADQLLPPEAKFNVILLAAAATFPFYHDRLDTLKRRVKGLRNFALTDEQERGYWEVPGVYNASLLYLVSGCFEEHEIDMPIIGMARYYQEGDRFDRPDIQELRAFLTDERHVWGPTAAGAVPGRITHAKKHGEMQTEAKTRESLVHIVKGGFA
ncbi:MAG: hypothetical protein QNJ45_07540 [Ardenticatenaceae bacterium]|nr:hypothetical protein [Ardenticatenaceae bacterium]